METDSGQITGRTKDTKITEHAFLRLGGVEERVDSQHWEKEREREVTFCDNDRVGVQAPTTRRRWERDRSRRQFVHRVTVSRQTGLSSSCAPPVLLRVAHTQQWRHGWRPKKSPGRFLVDKLSAGQSGRAFWKSLRGTLSGTRGKILGPSAFGGFFSAC